MKMSRILLDQSRRAFEARQNIQPLPNDRGSNASQSDELNRKNSQLHTYLRNLERNVRNKKGNQNKKIVNSIPSLPIQTTTAPPIRTAHSWQTASENSEKYWDDDLDSLKPPLNDGENSYGVSENGADDFTEDGTDNVSNHSQDSHNELNRLMKLKASLSEKEPEEPKAMKDIIDEVHVGDILPVYVTDINGPMKFWVAILLPKFTKQRETLYEQMQ